MLVRKGQCKRCGRCCTKIGFLVGDNPIVLEWLEARGLDIEKREYGTVATMDKPCKSLLAAGTVCNRHDDNKPAVCKAYPQLPGELLPDCGFYFEEEDTSNDTTTVD